ncbi:MAG TPA: alpha/beta hydrolase [Bryobacteraceae bacterium]|nr:alpha/beta hydrolase [Bryobacteraceae bacterium]
MPISEYYPYRSEEARNRCFAHLDAAAARTWPRDSREQVVATTYGRTLVRVTGPAAGRALVLLHGAGATSLMWSPNIRALSEEFRTFAVDQIGEFGKSICSTPVHGIADLLGWLDELFTGLDLDRGFNLLGVSYGGALAAQYALKFPTKLDKVVLLAPANTVLPCGKAFWTRLVLAAILRRRGVPSFMRWVFADMTKRDPAWVDSVVEEFFLNMESMERRWPVIPPVMTDAAWRTLTVPALFLVGEHEVIYSPRKAVARLKRVAPSVTTEIVPDAGHDLTVVQAEAVNRRIVKFLRQRESSAAGAPT